MHFRNRYVHFLGLMLVLIVLLSTSVVGCTTKKETGPGVSGSAKVQGIAWDDANGNGTRDTSEQLLTGPSMRLYGPYNYGPINRTSVGYYSFLVTPANGYSLECSATGFVTQTIYSIDLSSGETETHNFGMRRP